MVAYKELTSPFTETEICCYSRLKKKRVWPVRFHENDAGYLVRDIVDNKKNKYMVSDCPLAGKHLNQLSKDTNLKHDEALHPIEIMSKAYRL